MFLRRTENPSHGEPKGPKKKKSPKKRKKGDLLSPTGPEGGDHRGSQAKRGDSWFHPQLEKPKEPEFEKSGKMGGEKRKEG